MIDQTVLPEQFVYVETEDRQEIFDYIKRLVVRGAPAIGCRGGTRTRPGHFCRACHTVSVVVTPNFLASSFFAKIIPCRFSTSPHTAIGSNILAFDGSVKWVKFNFRGCFPQPTEIKITGSDLAKRAFLCGGE